VELERKLIRIDGGTQARAGLCSDTVAEYRETLRDSDATWPFPAVVVFYDGAEYWLGDGFHRLAAAEKHGRFVVEADVRQGTQRDAVLWAAGANAAHGLRRSAEDKRRAVMRLLEDEEWGQWSDREIARRCIVSHPTVATIRAELAQLTGKFTSERVYTNKHGETAVMQTAAIGNGTAAETDTDRRNNAYDWLRDYKDDKGRTWRDLEDSQVHHANSPCYQAYMRAFPGQVDPKFYLKQALSRLRQAADEENRQHRVWAAHYGLIGEGGQSQETAVEIQTEIPIPLPRPPLAGDRTTQSPYYVGPNAQSDVIREALNRYLDQWPVNRNLTIRRLANRKASGHVQAMGQATGALGASPMGIWHQAMVLKNNSLDEIMEPEDDTRTEADLIITHAALVDAHAQKGNRSWDSVISRLADPEASGHEYAVGLARNDTGLADDEIAQAAQTLLHERDQELQQSRGLVENEPELDTDDKSEANEGGGSDEWYTPAWLIDLAREVMGRIDIDPASSAEAQEVVQASHRWMAKDHMGMADGSLNVNWVLHNGPVWQPARVWLNPPYSYPLVERFVDHLLDQIEKGYVGEAILLVNNNTEAGWWHRAAKAAAVTFAFRSRIAFWRPDRENAVSPRQGQNAFYFGPNALRFMEVFSDKGTPFMRWFVPKYESEVDQ